MMLLVAKGPDLWGVFHEKMYVGGFKIWLVLSTI